MSPKKPRVEKNITIENARLIFRNFSGKPNRYNKEGHRNFCVVIDDGELLLTLKKDGWNVRTRPPREEGEEPLFYLPVKVAFNMKPPKIVMKTGDASSFLNELSVEVLDWADIEYVDLIVRPYNWEMSNGDTGEAAYLKTMYITLVEDELERKYRLLEEPDYEDFEEPA